MGAEYNIFNSPLEPKDRLPWVLLGFLIAVSGFYLGLQYHPYILPNVDYLRIRELAQELVTGQTPSDFKGMPLVSLLIGLLGLVMPASPDPMLHAGLVLNIAFSLLSLVLVYMLAREFLGGYPALIPVILLLAIPDFTLGALQPALEPTIGLLTLSTLVALARHSRWALVFGALASLTRYEMIVLIPVIFLVEIWRSPRHWCQHALRCTAAGLPFVIWFGLSMVVQTGGNPYVQEMEGMDFNVNWQILWTMHSAVPGPWPFMLSVDVLGWVAGFPVAFRRHPAMAFAIAVFFLLYTLAHIVFGIDRPRYAYPVLWVLPLFITVAAHAILLFAKDRADRLPSRVHMIGIAMLGAGVSGWIWLALLRYGRYTDSPDPVVVPPAFYLGWSLLLLVFLGGVAMLSARPPLRYGAVAGLVAMGLASMHLIVAGNVLAIYTSQKYFEKAEYAAAADWLAMNLPQDSRILVTMDRLILYSNPRISQKQLFVFDDLEAENHEQLIREMDTRGIEYAMFTRRGERPTDKDHTNYYRDLHYYLSRKVYLMDPFRHGQPVEGFEFVTSLPPPSPEWNTSSYVYRRTLPQVSILEPDDD